jgi:hypothetical protein
MGCIAIAIGQQVDGCAVVGLCAGTLWQRCIWHYDVARVSAVLSAVLTLAGMSVSARWRCGGSPLRSLCASWPMVVVAGGDGLASVVPLWAQRRLVAG